MSLDPNIEAAIKDAVQSEGQPAVVSGKLVKWLKEVVAGNERIDDKEATYQRIEGVCDAMKVDVEEAESE